MRGISVVDDSYISGRIAEVVSSAHLLASELRRINLDSHDYDDYDCDYLFGLLDRVQSTRNLCKDVWYVIWQRVCSIGINRLPSPVDFKAAGSAVELALMIFEDLKAALLEGKTEFFDNPVVLLHGKEINLGISGDVEQLLLDINEVHLFARRVFLDPDAVDENSFILTGIETFVRSYVSTLLACGELSNSLEEVRIWVTNSLTKPKGILSYIMRIGGTTGATGLIKLIITPEFEFIPGSVIISRDEKVISLNTDDSAIAKIISSAKDSQKVTMQLLLSQGIKVDRSLTQCPARGNAAGSDNMIVAEIIDRSLPNLPDWIVSSVEEEV